MIKFELKHQFNDKYELIGYKIRRFRKNIFLISGVRNENNFSGLPPLHQRACLTGVQPTSWGFIIKCINLMINLRAGKFEEKKMKNYKFPPKMNLCTKFHPNRTMGKWSNTGGKFSGGEFRRGRVRNLKKK